MTEAKLDEVIKIYTDNAEYVRQRGDLKGCMEFRELAEFLKECKKLLITCEDAVSREAVINGLASIAKAKAKSDAQKSMMGRAIFFVEQLQSVTSERAKGEWRNGNCSKCGSHAPYYSMSSAYYRSDFCPKCGADMRGGE